MKTVTGLTINFIQDLKDYQALYEQIKANPTNELYQKEKDWESKMEDKVVSFLLEKLNKDSPEAKDSQRLLSGVVSIVNENNPNSILKYLVSFLFTRKSNPIFGESLLIFKNDLLKLDFKDDFLQLKKVIDYINSTWKNIATLCFSTDFSQKEEYASISIKLHWS